MLPQLYQTELLFRSHDQMGHQGIDKVYQRILKRFEWPGMKKACEKWVTACLSCQQVKDPKKLRFPLQSIVSSEFNEVVQIDRQKICMTDNGYNQVLVMIDHFTKYAETVPCITASAEETCDHLINTWIALSDTEMKYGAPKAEMFAVVTLVEKYRAYLGSAPFKLRVDKRALSWLKTYSMDQSYIGRWIVRLDGYHMIIEHMMRDKHQNADSLSKRTEFYERLEQKQANQVEIKEGFSFLDKETYEALPLTRWLDKSGHPIPGHPELPVEKAAEIKILSREDSVPLDLLLRSNLVQQELSRMNINSLSLLDRTVQVTPQVMRMLGGLLEREVTRDDLEWTAAVASLTISEKVKIMPSRRQHEENERDCRTIVQQLVSSIPHEILTSTSYGQKEQGSSKRKKTVTFVDQDKEGEKVEQNLLQDYLSGDE